MFFVFLSADHYFVFQRSGARRGAAQGREGDAMTAQLPDCDRRLSRRTGSGHSGEAVIGSFSYPCVVADISAGGAKIRFDHPVFVQGRMRLCIGDTVWDDCQVIWRSGCELGIAFA